MPKPKRQVTADVINDSLGDLPPTLRDNMRVIQTRFDLEAHLRNIILSNPFVPPTGDKCPINDLPNELLAQIFTVGALEDDDEDEEDDMYQEEEDEGRMLDEVTGEPMEDDDGRSDGDIVDEGVLPFQVLVSHVCKHWRTVALEAPALWTSINFEGEEAPFTRCREWIERSKGLPIDITIDCNGPPDPRPDSEDDEWVDEDEDEDGSYTLEDLKLMLSIISPHYARWRALSITVTDYSFMRATTDVLTTVPSAPALEILQLYHYEETEDDNDYFQPENLRDPFPVLFSGNAPKLIDIALWGVHISWVDNLFLKGLRDIEIAYHTEDVRPTWEEFHRILSASPDLRVLALCLSGPRGHPGEWDSIATGSVELQALKELVIQYHPPQYIGPLLTRFNMPNLISLTMDFDSDTDDYTSFARQLASAPGGDRTKKSLLKSLEHLKISGLQCSREVIDLMYEQLGNLRSINLNCEYLPKEWFHTLGSPTPSSSTSASSSFYCPLLDTVTTSGITGRQMRGFVEIRKKAGVPVKRVYMNEDDDVDAGDEHWFRSHLEEFELFEGDSDTTDEVVEVEVDDGNISFTP